MQAPSLTEQQLRQVTAAALLRPHRRNHFLRSVAGRLAHIEARLLPVEERGARMSRFNILRGPVNAFAARFHWQF
jgi:hypothetical protein